MIFIANVQMLKQAGAEVIYLHVKSTIYSKLISRHAGADVNWYLSLNFEPTVTGSKISISKENLNSETFL